MVALGYLRTYSYLITHEPVFHIARQLHLIPANVAWTQLSKFMSGLEGITDLDVAGRFHYGEIRETYAPSSRS